MGIPRAAQGPLRPCAGHPERWRLLRYDVAHQETAEGRQEILAFLRTFL